jgi:hypothetical protein
MLNLVMHKTTTGHYSSDEQFHHCSAARDIIIEKRNKTGKNVEDYLLCLHSYRSREGKIVVVLTVQRR